MLRVLDLFSGIGGFSLGLERTGGFRTVAFCEIDPFCRKVLAKHWPEVPQYDDVRTLTAERLAADGIGVDVICGGFPCQDISKAQGEGRLGLDGERSGLWSEIARLARELRPQFVIVENVSALLSDGLDRVLGDLASFGFDAEWHCIPASAIGAPHQRDRLWLVAYPEGPRAGVEAGEAQSSGWRPAEGWGARLRPGIWRASHLGADAGSWWTAEPSICRVAHGVPHRSHRLRALGNAVVPQIPELIGRAILASQKDAA